MTHKIRPVDAVRDVFAKVPGPITVKDVYARTRVQPGFSGFTLEQIRQACNQLSKVKWLRKIGPALFERGHHAGSNETHTEEVNPDLTDSKAPSAPQRIPPGRGETWAVPEETVLNAWNDSTSLALSLECDHEAFIHRHLNLLEPDLKLWEADGKTGQQLQAGEAGRLDLLAVDSENNLVVIELKAGLADVNVLGQILGYMAWVRQTLSANSVRGIVVAHNFTERLRIAAQETPKVTLLRYEVKFEFTAA